MATYTPSLQNNIGFINALQLVKPNSLEETVQMVWQLIVTEWFPGRDGYKYSFKGPSLANGNMPDVTVIEVRAVVQNPRHTPHWAERQILLVECKRPSRDTPLGWEDTLTAQLEEDMSQTLNDSGRLFGAIAIGTKVRFYRYDGRADEGQTTTRLHQGTFDLREPAGISQVENMMNYIKAVGWQWASI
ncbi:hypothetical protein BJX64DRAFT_270331 [Aspergillus heterothallicus]